MDSITIFRDLCALGRAIVQRCASCCVSFEATARKLNNDKFRMQNGIDFNFQKLEGIRWNDIVKSALNTEDGEIIILQYNDKSRYQFKAVSVFYYICVFSQFAEEEGMKKGEINGLVLMKYEKEKEKEGEIIAEIEIPKNVGEVTRACEKDMTRHQLSYVHIEKSAQEGKGYIVGTNGNVLNVMAIRLHCTDEFSEINLPSEFIKSSKGAKVLVKKKEDGRIFAECGAKQFFDENLRYPKWKSVFCKINTADAIRLDFDSVRKHLKKAFVKVFGQECGIIRAEKCESNIHLDNHGNIKDIPAANVVHDIELYIPHDRFSKILGKMEYLYIYCNYVYVFNGKSCSVFISTKCAYDVEAGHESILEMILDGIKVDKNKEEAEHEAVIIEDGEVDNNIQPNETVESSNGECAKENAPESQAYEMEGNNTENNDNTAELLEISKDRIKRINYELLNNHYRIPLLFIHPNSAPRAYHLKESWLQMPGGFNRYRHSRIKAKSGAERIIPSTSSRRHGTWNNGNFAESANKAAFWQGCTNIRRANYTAKFGAYSRKLGTCDIEPNNRGPTTGK